MATEHNRLQVGEIERDFSKQLYFEGRGEAYLIDNSLAIRLRTVSSSNTKAGCLYIVTNEAIIRPKQAKEEILRLSSIKPQGLTRDLERRSKVLIIGAKYSLTYESRTSYKLRSSEPIKIVPVLPDVDLIALVTQKQAELPETLK